MSTDPSRIHCKKLKDKLCIILKNRIQTQLIPYYAILNLLQTVIVIKVLVSFFRSTNLTLLQIAKIY